MALPGNGLFVIQGEMATLMTAMRRGARWSSSSHQDEQNDNVVKSFQELKEILNGVGDLRLLDPNIYLDPFLQVIRSEETTGPVTSLALAAVNKFLSYGLIDPTHSQVPATVESIADAVTHARFVGTDQASDGAVLMEILQVLRTLMLSPEGAMLTNESVCEIMLSCFRICFESRLTELLRRTAKHCLRDMVQLLFMRLPQFAEDLRLSYNIKKLKMRAGNMDQPRAKRKSKNYSKNKIQNQVPVIKTEEPEDTCRDASVEDGLLTPTETRPPGFLRTHPLSTTPMTPAGNIVDLQGSISQSTPISNRNENTEENIDSLPDNQTNIIISVESPLNNELSNSASVEELSNTEDKIPDTEQFENINIQADNEHASKVTYDNCSIKSEDNDLTKQENSENEVQSSLENLSLLNNEEKSTKPENLKDNFVTGEYVNQQGVRFTAQAVNEGTALIPYGLPCVRELFRFLISLCNPLDQQNTELMTHTGLSLLTVAFEVAADSVGKYSVLLALVKDDLCKNLFALLSSERLSIFAADLQVCFLLFESLRSHLKFQLEFYLKKLSDIVISESPRVSYEQKEIALDSIVQLWHIPGLVTELYLNYDCDMYCSNLFEDLTKLLSKNAFPVSAGVYHTHLLSLDALLTIISSIEGHCHSSKINDKLPDVASIDDINDGSESKDEGSVVENISNFINNSKSGRQKVTENAPSYEDLMIIKNKKRWLATGSELFNNKPEKGIQFLQEHDMLAQPLDPLEIAHFLRENPQLDKKMIGEYISKRKSIESRILEVFVSSFDFADTRIDEALRLYLETFRLPGEAPLIFLVMEHFADHWHKCNNEPFDNTDAAFRLAYAIIMLNMDQHNHNAKKLNVPMTAEDFMKNLRGLNGNEDFDKDMLLAIYNSIKNEEIVMPAERTGLVRENYLWKVLLRRGNSRYGTYSHVLNGSYDKDLFALIWGPTVAALSFVFDKSFDPVIYQRAIQGFQKCATIAAYYNLSGDFDTLVLSLSKFTTLLTQADSNEMLSVTFGQNAKAQIAAKTVFGMAHDHGDIMREGWKNILDLMLQLYKCKLLPKSLTEAEDFCEPNGKISLIRETVPLPKTDTGIFSSLYSYIALSSETANQRVPTHEEQEHIKKAKVCIRECTLEQLVIDSKFLQLEALQELTKCLIAASKGPDGHKSLGIPYNEDATVFFLELLIKILIQNRDRVLSLWPMAKDHLYILIMGASSCDYQYLLTRAVTGLLRLAICLMRNEDMAPIVLQSLKMLLLLKPTLIFRISKQISTGLYELLKTSAQNIHNETDWDIVFTLLECVGAGAIPPKILDEHSAEQGAKSDGALSSEDENVVSERGYTSDSELSKKEPLISPKHTALQTGDSWIMINKESDATFETSNQFTIEFDVKLLPHSPVALVKCWESLAFIVRDVAHITPYNFQSCVRCIRTFVEATLHGNIRKKTTPSKDRKKKSSTGSKRRDEWKGNRSNKSDDESTDGEELPDGYQLIAIQLLDLMHTLHTRTAQIFIWWAEEGSEPPVTSLWSHGWRPLLQGIARLCCDTRKQVRTSAMNYLQRALLVHDLRTLSASEWESCFTSVLFPLLEELLSSTQSQQIKSCDTEEARIRGSTIMSKVFLHHLTPLTTLENFTALWINILDFLDRFMKSGSDLLYEAVLESLKNMLLVMHSIKTFQSPQGLQLWDVTWQKINIFLPNLKQELFKEHESQNQQHQVHEENKQYDLDPVKEVETTQQIIYPSQQQDGMRSPSGSIILQPPAISSPLFTHLGQMVSTPIGAPTSNLAPSQYPILISPSVPQNQITNITSPSGIPFQYYTNPEINYPERNEITPEKPIEPVPDGSRVETIPAELSVETQNPLLMNPYQHAIYMNSPQTDSIYLEHLQNPYTTQNQSFYTNPVEYHDPNLNYSQVYHLQNQAGQENSTINSYVPHYETLNQNSPAHVSNISQENNDLNTVQNVFQSSNYFTQGNIIPPGSEILFGVSTDLHTTSS